MHHNKFLQCAVIVALTASVLACSTVSAPRITTTPTLDVGKPISNSNWEVTIKSAHEENQLKNSTGGSYTPKDSYTFWVVNIVFHNLDSAQETEFTEDEVAVINSDGESFPAIGSSDYGSYWTATGTTYTLEGTTTFDFTGLKEQQLGLVFTVKKGTIDGAVKLKFKDLPLIPFTVESE